jgi:hypothetical protein
MIKRSVLIACLLAGTAAADTVVRDDFAYGNLIVPSSPATGYRVALPADVYRAAVREDIGDLRVFNGSGEVVPYALQSPHREAVQKQSLHALPLFPLSPETGTSLDAIRITIESGRGAVNVQAQGAAKGKPTVVTYILDARAVDRPLAALELEWAADAAEFAGRFRVEASDDLSAWRLVLPGAAIANLGSQAERLIERRIEFSPVKMKYWRLTWIDGQAKFALTGAQGEPAQDVVELARASEVLTPQADPKRPNEFEYDTAGRLPVDRLELKLPELNSVVQAEIESRPTKTAEWRHVTRRGFYRLKSDDAEVASGWVPIDLDTDRYWLVKIDRGGGLGTGTPKLTLGWVPHELVFIARGSGPFQLAYGSATALPDESPVESILAEIAKPGDGKSLVTIVTATLAPQVVLGGEERRFAPHLFPWKSVSLWAALAIGVILLAWMAMRLARETNKP